MLRAYQADAKRFEEKLSDLRKSAEIVAEFRAIEGRMAEVVYQTTGAGDVAVFGFKRAVRDSGSVLLILGEDSDPPEFASVLAAGLHKRLIVLTSVERKSNIEAWYARHQGPVPEIHAYSDRENLLRRLDALSPAAVIVAADRSEVPTATRIVNAARCPVILTAAETG